MGWLSDDSGAQPLLWRDLRSGQVGLAPRLALSVIAALVLAALAMLVLGIIEVVIEPVARTYTFGGGVRTYAHTPIRDEHVVVALSVAAVLWFVCLLKIWATYGRFRNVLRCIFVVLAIWAVVIPLCVAIDLAVGYSGELLIVGCVLCAIGGSILVITMTAYRAYRGKMMYTPQGELNLNCPSCGYSMVGLEQSRCPECGTGYTLDELIQRQNYGGLDAQGSENSSPPTATSARVVDPPLRAGPSGQQI